MKSRSEEFSSGKWNATSSSRLGCAQSRAPDRIVWVRPRDPWMLNRAVVQPDPVVGLRLVADTMEAAASAESLDDLLDAGSDVLCWRRIGRASGDQLRFVAAWSSLRSLKSPGAVRA